MYPKSDRIKNYEILGVLLTSFVNKNHELFQLAEKIDWEFLSNKFKPSYKDRGRAGVSIRLLLGLNILKYMYNLSDEEVCAMWVENPYYQYFCGELYFRHELPMDRSSMTNFRKRIGSELLEAVLQESLRTAHSVGALDLKSIDKVAVDTTVQPKSITYPTDSKLLCKAIEQLAIIAKAENIELRQSYSRVSRYMMIKSLRYRNAKQHNRANRCEKKLRTWLGRLLRDVRRKFPADEEMSCNLKEALIKARKIYNKSPDTKDRLYSWHAPEVECIVKGKIAKPAEFGCKVGIATNLHSAPGGHFVLHAKALHGRPFDGHTLNISIEHIIQLTGKTPKRIFVDKGYTGHNYPEKQRVYKSGQKRGVTMHLKREIRRRSVVEPIIGHVKNDCRMNRNWLKGQEGDRANAILAATGYNFRRILAFLRLLLSFLLQYLLDLHTEQKIKSHYNPA